MPTSDKRKTDRIDSLNLFYVTVNEDDVDIHQGMGRTLDLSETGALLEIIYPIDIPSIIVLSVGLKDDVLEVKGKAVHQLQRDNGRFGLGIEFFDVTDSMRETLNQFIESNKDHFTASDLSP